MTQDNLVLALHDKEKSIQLRELRHCPSLLSRFGLADTLSSLQFTSDNQYLAAASLNSRDQGGGLIYLFKVEHNQASMKAHNQRLHWQRNPEKAIIVDENRVSHFPNNTNKVVSP
jgi:hypothetical protein